jgi:hypothetical protein
MSKVQGRETAVWVSEQAIQILGRAGYVREHPVERWYSGAMIFTIFEGTSEILRLLIARAISRRTHQAVALGTETSQRPLVTVACPCGSSTTCVHPGHAVKRAGSPMLAEPSGCGGSAWRGAPYGQGIRRVWGLGTHEREGWP